MNSDQKKKGFIILVASHGMMIKSSQFNFDKWSRSFTSGMYSNKIIILSFA